MKRRRRCDIKINLIGGKRCRDYGKRTRMRRYNKWDVMNGTNSRSNTNNVQIFRLEQNIWSETAIQVVTPGILYSLHASSGESRTVPRDTSMIAGRRHTDATVHTGDTFRIPIGVTVKATDVRRHGRSPRRRPGARRRLGHV